MFAGQNHFEKMYLKIVIFCFIVAFHRVQCQECRVVSICNDEDEISNSARNLNTGNTGRRGEKGGIGSPGKAGPQGIMGLSGPIGPLGRKGEKGESGSTESIEVFQEEIRNLITDFNRSLSSIASQLKTAQEQITLLFPTSCSQSDKRGVERLFSGEKVYCDQQWRVIQRRFNGQVVFHNRNWVEYKNGFGNLSTEFWIGLDKVHRLTSNGGCRLRIELGAYDNSQAFAEYSDFSVGSESDLFRLHISGYSGTAGNSFNYNSHDHNNMAFSTVDRHNDRSSSNCAVIEGGAWWHRSCGYSKLNGRWGKNLGWNSLIWYTWRKQATTLKSSMMMIRCE